MTHWRATLAQILRHPAFPVTASVLLALGIGVNTTVFTVLETVLLRPLPYPAADQLVAVLEANPSKHELASLIAPARLEDWNRLNQAFTAISGSYSENVTDTSANAPERLSAVRVSPRYFQVYQKKPVASRIFNQQDCADSSRFRSANHGRSCYSRAGSTTPDRAHALGLCRCSIGASSLWTVQLDDTDGDVANTGIGTRMAPRAYTGQVITGVFASAAKLMIPGLAIGMLGAMAVAHLLRSFLFAVSPEDPLTYFTVGLVLTTICFVATLLPAPRAASIDPLRALRNE